VLDFIPVVSVSLRMNKVTFRVALICAVVVTSLLSSVDAAEKKKPTPEPVRPFLSAVNGDSITVTTGQSAKTMTLKPNSEIVVNGQKATAADLKTGMLVSSVGAGTDATVVSRISVADAPPTPATGGRKKKSKE